MLPPRQRSALVLRYFEDLTEVQTAEVMGVAVGTVKSLSHQAVTRLRSQLGADSMLVAEARAPDGPLSRSRSDMTRRTSDD